MNNQIHAATKRACALRIRDMRRDGLTYEQIAARLQTEQWPHPATLRGKNEHRWNQTYVSTLLAEVYPEEFRQRRYRTRQTGRPLSDRERSMVSDMVADAFRLRDPYSIPSSLQVRSTMKLEAWADHDQYYQTREEFQPCPTCGGKAVVETVDVTYPERLRRRQVRCRRGRKLGSGTARRAEACPVHILEEVRCG